MKRRLSTDFDVADQTERMFVGSPAHKQARSDVTRPWDAAAATSDLQALCRRISDGLADADDLREMLRLTLGGMVGGVASAWRAADRDPSSESCAPLVEAYGYLWSSLNSYDRASALAAVRQIAPAWPPTFDDAVRAYVAADPNSATEHLDSLQERARNRPIAGVVGQLVESLDAAVRRRRTIEAAHVGPFESFGSPFATDDWTPVVDPQSVDRIGGCNPRRSYFILELEGDDDNRVALFTEPRSGDAELVEAVIIPHGEPATSAQRFAPEVKRDERDNADLVMPDALRPYEASLVPFLASLASLTRYYPHEEDREGLEEDFAAATALFDPTPAGAQQIKAAMVPIPSQFALPASVHGYIDTIYEDPEGDWYLFAMRGVRIDECRLVLALRLFEAQIGARRVAQRYVPQTLSDFAARAYRGPLRRGMAPDEVIDRAAAYAWQTTCAAPTLPSGRLPNADRLLDVAALWNIEPNLTERARPELLCGQLGRVVAERDSAMAL